MTASHRRFGPSVVAATLAAGLLATGCGARSSGEGNANATVNLSSLPAAEAWVDGKPAGSTPLAVPLSPGRHELVLKQTGFSEHRQTLEVAAGAVASVDATLLPDDPMDPDAVRQIAAAYGVTVEPFRAPEVHRGAAVVGGVALLFPRNDVRREGLLGYRIDVTPAYEGGGFLEFRKGKTSLYREKFEPNTLVNAASLPKAVLDAVKTGDTVTWGVYFTDARKPITAQFEVVAKPTASRKLAELSADRRLALQPAVLRQQLEAEVLQNYRLYSEALVRLLDMRAADKDNTSPYTGIVTCLRRLDLEDTALFTEAASKAIGVTSRRRAPNVGVASKRPPVGTMPAGGAPAADPADSAQGAPFSGRATPDQAAPAVPPTASAPSARNVPGAPARGGEIPTAGRKPEVPGAPPALVTPPAGLTPPPVETDAAPVGPETAPIGPDATEAQPTDAHPAHPTPGNPPSQPTDAHPAHPTPGNPPSQPAETQPTHPTPGNPPNQTDPIPSHPTPRTPPAGSSETPPPAPPAPAPVPPVPPVEGPTPPGHTPPAPVPPAPILPK